MQIRVKIHKTTILQKCANDAVHTTDRPTSLRIISKWCLACNEPQERNSKPLVDQPTRKRTKSTKIRRYGFRFSNLAYMILQLGLTTHGNTLDNKRDAKFHLEGVTCLLESKTDTTGARTRRTILDPCSSFFSSSRKLSLSVERVL
jgi:hypothetical protein